MTPGRFKYIEVTQNLIVVSDTYISQIMIGQMFSHSILLYA